MSEPTDVDALANYLSDQVEDECPKCGAWMLNPALHEQWHGHLKAALDEIAVEAGRYKSPPTYR